MLVPFSDRLRRVRPCAGNGPLEQSQRDHLRPRLTEPKRGGRRHAVVRVLRAQAGTFESGATVIGGTPYGGCLSGRRRHPRRSADSSRARTDRGTSQRWVVATRRRARFCRSILPYVFERAPSTTTTTICWIPPLFCCDSSGASHGGADPPRAPLPERADRMRCFGVLSLSR